jgi:hypothetical protein
MRTLEHHFRRCRYLVVCMLMLVLGAGQCSPGQSNPSTQHATSTAQETTTAAPTSEAVSTEPSTTQAPPTTSISPETVVRSYFDAINSRNYRKAWRLGGKNLGQPYANFAQGFADTDHDTSTVLKVNGPSVTIKLVATHSDGQQITFRGTYIVRQGEIVAAHVVRVSAPPAGLPSGSGCDPSYPDFCIPPPPPDLDCPDIGVNNFTVLSPDPHRFDADHDGIGCERR